MRGLFVTGTDTGAGKTLVACALIHALRATGRQVAAMKPVASGCEETAAGLISDDASQLAAASGLGTPIDLANPYRFRPAIAPHVAAAQAGVRIDLKRIAGACRALADRADCVVVEGVGGLRVPLNDNDDVADLAALLRLPVVLVVGVRLGCLNHALLTAEAIDRRGLPWCGWVANHVDPDMAAADENIDALTRRLGVPLLGRVPFTESADARTLADVLDVATILTALDGADN
ncbi:MAG: dethiobiotin synthase [Burkholderiales bacterium]